MLTYYIVMITELLAAGILLGAFTVPLFFRARRKKNTIRLPKNYRDTSQAQYAINENGFLERIQHDKKLSSHA